MRERQHCTAVYNTTGCNTARHDLLIYRRDGTKGGQGRRVNTATAAAIVGVVVVAAVMLPVDKSIQSN